MSTGEFAGTAYSPSRQGTVTRRPIIGITGRERMASWMTRSTSSAPSPARTASRSRSWASGKRTRRSQAQASELAVVSCPARTSVSSSSRTSLSLSVSPSSVVAWSSIDRMSRRSPRSAAPRRSAITR